VVREQHFVPRHYLRQFGYPGTERISLARIDPFKYAINASIGDQCKEDYFYGEDGEVDELIQIAENDLAPSLRTVCGGNSFDYQHLNALTVLTVLLRLRTRKAAKEAGLIPQREFYEVTQAGIDAGHIPAPKGGWTRDMVDVEGAPGFLIGFTIECWMELFTLTPKLLLAPASAVFVTGDHPVILLSLPKERTRCDHFADSPSRGSRSCYLFPQAIAYSFLTLRPTRCRIIPAWLSASLKRRWRRSTPCRSSPPSGASTSTIRFPKV
jgi:hypothetical protein